MIDVLIFAARRYA